MDTVDELPPVDIPPPITYEATLAYTQGIRRMVSGKLIEKGIPTDKESVDMLLKTLKDMDGTALTERKNAIESDNAGSNREIAEALQLLSKTQANKNPFMRRPDGSVSDDLPEVPKNIPSADVEKLGAFEHTAGEDHIGVVQESADEFFARMEREGHN